MDEPRYDAETLRKVAAVAARLQTERDNRRLQPREDLTAEEMDRIGAEVGLDPALMRQALGQVTAAEAARQRARTQTVLAVFACMLLLSAGLIFGYKVHLNRVNLGQESDLEAPVNLPERRPAAVPPAPQPAAPRYFPQWAYPPPARVAPAFPTTDPVPMRAPISGQTAEAAANPQTPPEAALPPATYVNDAVRPNPAPSAVTTPDRDELQRLFLFEDAALHTRDVIALKSLHDPSYVLHLKSGEDRTYADVMQQLDRLPLYPAEWRADHRLVQLRFTGADQAELTLRARLDYLDPGAAAHMGIVEQNWRRVGGRWLKTEEAEE